MCLRGSGLVEDYSEAKQSAQLFSFENNLSIYEQMLDYAHRNRCTRIVRRKGGVKEFRINWLEIYLS